MTTPRVLQLASSDEAFFDQQIRALEAHGIDCTKLVIPEPPGDRAARGLREYASFYRDVLDERTAEYDLVHANYGLIGPLALAQPIRPVVLTIWGSEVMGYTRRLDRITRFAAQRSDAVIAPNRTVSERLNCDHHVVPFGINLELFRPIDRLEARRRLGWDRDALIVLFPYDPSRNVKRYDLAEELVARASVPAELRTVSGRPYEEMPLVMNASDVLLVTSERESGPMVVREAAACNVPVVSTDVGFVRETLGSVKNCYVTDNRRQLLAGLNAALRSSGRSNGRAVVRDFDLDRHAVEIISIYRELLDRPVPTPVSPSGQS